MILFSRPLDPCCAVGSDANTAPTAKAMPMAQTIPRPKVVVLRALSVISRPLCV